MNLLKKHLNEYSNYLCQEEKSLATQEKYLRDVYTFYLFVYEKKITKELVIEWKNALVDRGYAIRSVNSMLASVNSLLDFLGLSNCKVKNMRTQQQTFCNEDMLG